MVSQPIYFLLFNCVTSIKAAFHLMNRNYIASYEAESTLAIVMKLQMQVNFIILLSSLLYIQPLSDSYGLFNFYMTCLYYIVTLVLTDYRHMFKVYRYENRALRDRYPVRQFIAIQVFMMLSSSILLTVQWYKLPILSDIISLLLCTYNTPIILKCNHINIKPNVSLYNFIDDYLILVLYFYFRAYDDNILQLQPDISICITIAVFVTLQQIILIYQKYVSPQLTYQKQQVDIICEYYRDIGIYQSYTIEGNNYIECSICLETVQQQLQIQASLINEVVITGCGHTFHENCLIGWLQVKSICPICRGKFT